MDCFQLFGGKFPVDVALPENDRLVQFLFLQRFNLSRTPGRGPVPECHGTLLLPDLAQRHSRFSFLSAN